MHDENYRDEDLAKILKATKTIAVVGGSPERNRPSYSVMQFLQKRGFRIVPVNPRAAGETILGEKVYASLADIPFPIDMVDIFRTSDAAGQVSDEAIAVKAKFVWMQLGVHNDAAAARARAAGLQVVMDRCSKIEFGRLSGQIGFMGVDTGIINNSRRRRV
ncbi:MAG TPA: CoA-binding protein [Alphaproteobacteria bacterium]|nr:CoA-binding protein [Alphaproteobacteria bacterium]